MGRPLYPQSFHAPIVRVEPEPEAYPAPQKWSYWNRFDPDADEFFENDDAVFEAVIDASQPPVRMQGTGENAHASAGEDSSSSSDGSSSGRNSPLEEYDSVRNATAAQLEDLIVPQRFPERSVSGSTGENSSSGTQTNRGDDPSFGHLIPANILEYRPDERRLVPISASSNSPILDTALRRTPSPTPVTIPLDRPLDTLDPMHVSGRGSAPMVPSTPPNQRSVLYGTPSPAPSVTPRLFQWSIRPVTAVPISPSPSSPGPFTNHSARRSVAHINAVPSLVPLHRVVG